MYNYASEVRYSINATTVIRWKANIGADVTDLSVAFKNSKIIGELWLKTQSINNGDVLNIRGEAYTIDHIEHVLNDDTTAYGTITFFNIFSNIIHLKPKVFTVDFDEYMKRFTVCKDYMLNTKDRHKDWDKYVPCFPTTEDEWMRDIKDLSNTSFTKEVLDKMCFRRCIKKDEY